MMGKSHAMSGSAVALSGAALAIGPIAIGQQDLAVVMLYTSVFIGGTLWCDWDSNSATVVRSFGIFGKGFHELINAIGLLIYNLTKTKYDEKKENGHRTFFHTPVAAILTGLIISLLASLPGKIPLWGHNYTLGQIFSLIIMWMFLHVGLTGIFEKSIKKARKMMGVYIIMGVSLLATFGVSRFLPEQETYWWLGFAAAGGMIVHMLGDMITKMGVPLLWPLKIRGKRWYDVTLPTFMRIKAGGSFENIVLFPLFSFVTYAALIVCLVPGLADTVRGWLHH